MNIESRQRFGWQRLPNQPRPPSRSGGAALAAPVVVSSLGPIRRLLTGGVYWCGWCLVFVAIVWSGCSSKAAGQGDAGGVDVFDSFDACVPGCHFDCFGGIRCYDGDVWLLAHATVPCCQHDDPWPYSLPECGERATYTCAEGCGYFADPRYAYCMEFTGEWPLDPMADSLLSLHCIEGAPKDLQHPCEDDADCRPAMDSVDRLRCDQTLSACVAETRPATPMGFGENCGLVSDNLWPQDEDLSTAPNCDLCHYRYLEGDSCVSQACTVACEYDEDCPAGTACLCRVPYGEQAVRFCAPVADLQARTTPEGRTAWLTCQ